MVMKQSDDNSIVLSLFEGLRGAIEFDCKVLFGFYFGVWVGHQGTGQNFAGRAEGFGKKRKVEDWSWC